MKNSLRLSDDNKKLLRFLGLFFGFYALFYYTSLFLLGAADPRGAVYWPTFSRYFNVFVPLTDIIIRGAMQILKWLGYHASRPTFNRVQIDHISVSIASVCLGYGVMSFWLAFVMANKMHWLPRIIWSIGGLFAIYLINTIRVALIVIGRHDNWLQKGHSHDFYHTSFNVAAYICIFFLIWRFYVWDKKQSIDKESNGIV